MFGDPDKSDYADGYEFWQALSKNGDPDDIVLDDLIKYIADNFNEKAMDESKTNKLLEDLKSIREACTKSCSELALAVLKKQEEIVKENADIITREKQELKRLNEKLEQLKEEQAELEGQEEQHTGIIGHDEELAEVRGKLKANSKKMDNVQEKIDMLTVFDSSNPGKTIAEQEAQQASFARQMRDNKRKLLELLGKNNIKLQDTENNGRPITQQAERGTQGGGNGRTRWNGISSGNY